MLVWLLATAGRGHGRLVRGLPAHRARLAPCRRRALWAFAPPFLIALGDGRPGAVLAHVLLGWLAFAAFGAATSWAAAATASLLFAAVIAAAPSLAPALIVAWVVALAVSGRAAVRLAALPIPALALALPLIIEQIGRGNPIALLADPGLPVASPVPTHLAARPRLPRRLVGRLGRLLRRRADVDFRLALSALILPSCSLAHRRRVRAAHQVRAVLALGVALLGFATAVGASHLAVATVGPAEIALWTGAGLSLAWLGLVLAAVVALDAMRRGPAAARIRGASPVCSPPSCRLASAIADRPGRGRPGQPSARCPRSSSPRPRTTRA